MTKNRQVQTNIISYPDFKMTATMPKKQKLPIIDVTDFYQGKQYVNS